MLSVQTIRKLLNGGGTVAGVKGLRKAIAELESELDAHRLELDQMPAKCADEAMADDAEKAIEAMHARENHLYAALEVGEARLGRLRERLNELTISDRTKEYIERRDAIIVAAEKFISAVRPAHEAIVELNALREQFYGAGFAVDVANIPIAPALVNLFDPEQMQIEMFARAIEQYRMTAPNTPLRKSSSAAPGAPRVLPDPIIPHGEPTHGVRLFPPPAIPDAAKRVVAPRVQRQRAPLPEKPVAGEVRCRVIHSGYPDPKAAGPAGYLLTGEQVDLPAEIARAAVERGALEFVANESEQRP